MFDGVAPPSVGWSMPWSPPGDAPPPPTYNCWDDYLSSTAVSERRGWCTQKAKKANRSRLLSPLVDVRVTTEQVWHILETARGRCAHCTSLAVEHRPSRSNGSPSSWAAVGRRIGSLDHAVSRVAGGSNDASNLRWTCLWCNTWPRERRVGAVDHRGYYPAS